MRTTIGPYQILEEVARGGMGAVYRGRHASLERDVAIKVLLRGGEATEHQRRRFLREARAMSRLEHPAIVRVHAVGEVGDELYMGMDFVPGESLQHLLDREGPLPVERAVELARTVAGALAHAHAAGIVHRDLKPANVLIDVDGAPRLTDFGLAKDLSPSHSQSLSVRGRFMGTPGYWSPEQARGQLDRIGPPTDVYGLGAVLHAMLTGEPPHGEPGSLIEALASVDRVPAPPSSLRAGVPPAVDAIVARCLALDPAERYPSADALAAALAGDLDGPVEKAPAARGWVLAASVAILAAGVALGLLILRAAPDPSATARAPATQPEATSPPALPQAPASPREPLAAPVERSPDPAAPSPASRPASRPVADGDDAQTLVREAGRGQALLDAGQHAAARQVFTGVIERGAALSQGDLAVAYYNRGLARGKLGDLQGMVEDSTAAIGLDPGLALAHHNRGLGRMRLGERVEAIADFGAAIRLDPNLAVAYELRSEALLALGEFRRAIADCDVLCRLAPRDSTHPARRGYARLQLGELEAAVEDYSAALRLKPRADLYSARAVIRGQLGDWRGQVADCTEAIRLDPSQVRYLAQRALGRWRQGELAAALADCDEVIRREPRVAGHYLRRADIREEHGDPPGALADLGEAIRLEPDHASTYDRRGMLRAENDDPAGAIADWERFLTLEPGDERVSRNLATARELLAARSR